MGDMLDAYNSGETITPDTVFEDAPEDVEGEPTASELGSSAIEFGAFLHEGVGAAPEKPVIGPTLIAQFGQPVNINPDGTYKTELGQHGLAPEAYKAAVRPLFQATGNISPWDTTLKPYDPEFAKQVSLATGGQLAKMMVEEPEAFFRLDPDWAGPQNWTESELMTLTTGYDAPTWAMIEANEAAYETAKAAYDAGRQQLAYKGAIFGNVDPVTGEDFMLEGNSSWTRLIDDYGETLGDDVVTGLLVSLSTGLDDERIHQLASFGHQWLTERPEFATDADLREEWLGSMIIMSYQLTGQFLAEVERAKDTSIPVLGGFKDLGQGLIDAALPGAQFEDDGIMNGLGNIFAPIQEVYVQGGKQFAANWWAGTFDPGNPNRPHMTMGQNMAISMGFDPGETGFSMSSGTLDAVGEIVFDPLTWMAGFGKALSLSSRVGLGAGAAAKGNRFTRTLRSIISSHAPGAEKFGLGRHAIGATWKGPKGPFTRAMYSLMAREIDDIAAASGKGFAIQNQVAKKTFMRLGVLSQGENAAAAILREFPMLENGVDVLAPLFADAFEKHGWEGVGQVWSWSAKGTLKASDDIVNGARRTLVSAQDELQAVIEYGVANGDLTLGTVKHVKYGASQARAIQPTDLMVGSLNDGGLFVRRPRQINDGAQVFAWSRKPALMGRHSPESMKLLEKASQRDPLARRLYELVLTGPGPNNTNQAIGNWIKSLSKAERNRLRNLAQNMGYDGMKFGDTMLVSQTKMKNLVSIIDDVGTRANQDLVQALNKERKAQWLVSQADSLTDEIWWVDNLPTGKSLPKVLELPGFKQMRSLGYKFRTGDYTGWMAQYARNKTAKLRAMPPDKMSYYSTPEGIAWIKAHGKRAAVPKETIDNWIAELVNTPYELRPELAGKIMEETAVISGDARILYNMRGNQNFNPAYLINDAGGDVAKGQSKSRADTIVGKPHQPSMLSDGYPTMDAAHYTEMDKLRQAKGVMFGGLSGRGTWLGEKLTGTQSRRQQLVDYYKTGLKQNMPEDAFNLLDDEDFFAFAYSTVIEAGPGAGVNGVGTVSRIGHQIAPVWNFVHKSFSLTALAARHVTWPLKVVFGEESIRASLAGMDNMFTAPIRHAQLRNTARAVRKTAATRHLVEEGMTLHRSVVLRSFDDAVEAGADVNALARRADELMPGVKLDDIAELTPARIRTRLNAQISQEFKVWNYNISGQSFGKQVDDALKRETKAARKLADNYGILSVDEAIESFNDIGHDIFESYSDFHRASLQPQALRRDNTKLYAIGRMDEMARDAYDPFFRYAVKRRLAALDNVRPPTLNSITKTGGWQKMRPTIDDIAADAGLQPYNMTDNQLAKWYFEDFYKNDILFERYKSFLNNADGVYDPELARKFYDDILEGRQVELPNGGPRISLNKGDMGAYRPRYEEWLDNEYAMGHRIQEPLNVTAAPNVFEHSSQSRWAEWRRTPWNVNAFNRAMVESAGHNVTQKFTRQPGFLGQYKAHYDRYIDIGWSPERANMAAKIKATETINTLMYNMDNASELVKKFNKVMPFGAAMIEVTKVWFWDLPIMAQGALPGFGHLYLARKLDRIEQGLESMGILFRDPDTGQTEIISMRGGYEGQQPAGAFVSDFLARGMQMTTILGQQVAGLRDHIFGDEAEFDGEENPYKTEVPVAFAQQLGNPLNVRSNGVFAVNRFGLGLNPVAALGVHAMSQRTQLLAESIKVNTNGVKSLAELAQESGQEDSRAFWQSSHNLQALREDDRDLFLLINNTDDPLERQYLADSWVPSAATELEVPNSGWAREAFDDVLFPFGRTHDVYEMIRNFTPNYIQTGLRSLGIHEHSGDGEPGILATLLGPNAVYKTDSNLWEGMAYANMRYGYGDKMFDALDKIQVIEQELIDGGQAQRGEDGELRTTTATDMAVYNEKMDQIMEHREEIEEYDEAAITYAINHAATKGMMQASLQYFVPGSPRMFTEEQLKIQEVWDTREVAEAIEAGEGPEALVRYMNRPHRDLAASFDIMGAWLQERGPHTSDVRKFFADENEGMAMFIEPKSVYNGNAFPEFHEDAEFDVWMEDWTRKLRAGDAHVVSPNVQLQRYWNSRLNWEELAAERALGGDDPVLRGIWAINNWGEWSENQADFTSKRAGLRLYDEMYQNGEYAEIREEQHAATGLTSEEIANEQANFDKRWDDLNQDLDDLTTNIRELDSLDIDPAEREELRDHYRQEERLLNRALDDMRSMREDYNYGNDTDHVISMYFDTIWGPYKAERDAIFAGLDDDLITDLDRSLIFDKIRHLENRVFQTSFTLWGEAIPNPLQWVGSLRSPEDAARRNYKVIGKKIDWANIQETQDLVAAATAAGIEGADLLLPTTASEYEIYEWRSDLLNDLKDQMNVVDPDETPYGQQIKQSQFNKAKDAIDEAFFERLATPVEQGGLGRPEEAAFLQMRPNQQLAALGLLPNSLASINALANDLQLALDAAEKSVGTEQGKYMFRTITWPQVEGVLRNNTVAHQELLELGALMYGEDDPEKIFRRLFMGQFVF